MISKTLVLEPDIVIKKSGNVDAIHLKNKAGSRKKANAATSIPTASLELIVMQNLDKKQCADGTRTTLSSQVTNSILVKGATIGGIVLLESVTQ